MLKKLNRNPNGKFLINVYFRTCILHSTLKIKFHAPELYENVAGASGIKLTAKILTQ